MPKRKVETLESLLARPWCFYCDRDFDDVSILVAHMKHKHYQCTVASCHRKLNTVGGLRVHLQQVHKEELPQVPNALEGRDDPNIEIFAMEGIPQDLIDLRTAYVTREYRQMEAEFYQRTGNPLPGTGGHQAAWGSKRPKMESKEDLKARALAYAAKRKAEKAEKAAAAATGGPNSYNGDNNNPTASTQATPTPPGMGGYGGPATMVSMPVSSASPAYLTGGIASSSPITANALSASNQSVFQQFMGSGNPPSSSPPASSWMSLQPHPSVALPQVPLRAGPPLSASAGYGGPAGLPPRPMPAFQLPPRPSVSPPSETLPFDQAALDKLMDEAQANVAKMKRETAETASMEANQVQTGPPNTVPNSVKVNNYDVTTSTAASITRQLLHNEVESFEELKASHYRIESQPDVISTGMATQGAAGPVDEDVETS